jgi:hypothetical protein
LWIALSGSATAWLAVPARAEKCVGRVVVKTPTAAIAINLFFGTGGAGGDGIPVTMAEYGLMIA